MKVTLTAPPWSVMGNPYPPLGLGYLAAVLEHDGHTVSLRDFGLQPGATAEQAAREIMSDMPDLVGISVMSHSNSAAISLARAIKRIGREVPIVVGGPHPTIFPLETLAEPAIDYVARGEGEQTLSELVTALERGGGFETISGLCFKKDGEALQNDARPFIDPLDFLPVPARSLMNVSGYPLKLQDEPMTTMLTSRGCPYGCTYCYKGLFGHKYREHSAEYVLDEIATIVREQGIRNIYFVDDLFILNLGRLNKIIQGIRERALDIRWQCLARVDRALEPMFSEMKSAGCDAVHFGIETGNEQMLKRIRKRITLEQVRNAVTWAHQAGIRTRGYFMIGLPGDTEDTIMQTFEFAYSLPLDNAMFSIATPFPGSQLWEELKPKIGPMVDPAFFDNAYYHAGYSQKSELCFNLSSVSDQRLVELARKADELFWENNIRRREFRQCFGPRLGDGMWRLSRWTPLRALKPVRKLGRFVKGNKPASAAIVRS